MPVPPRGAALVSKRTYRALYPFQRAAVNAAYLHRQAPTPVPPPLPGPELPLIPTATGGDEKADSLLDQHSPLISGGPEPRGTVGVCSSATNIAASRSLASESCSSLRHGTAETARTGPITDLRSGVGARRGATTRLIDETLLVHAAESAAPKEMMPLAEPGPAPALPTQTAPVPIGTAPPVPADGVRRASTPPPGKPASIPNARKGYRLTLWVSATTEAGLADAHGLLQLDGADPIVFCQLKGVDNPLARALQEAFVALGRVRASPPRMPAPPVEPAAAPQPPAQAAPRTTARPPQAPAQRPSAPATTGAPTTSPVAPKRPVAQPTLF